MDALNTFVTSSRQKLLSTYTDRNPLREKQAVFTERFHEQLAATMGRSRCNFLPLYSSEPSSVTDLSLFESFLDVCILYGEQYQVSKSDSDHSISPFSSNFNYFSVLSDYYQKGAHISSRDSSPFKATR